MPLHMQLFSIPDITLIVLKPSPSNRVPTLRYSGPPVEMDLTTLPLEEKYLKLVILNLLCSFFLTTGMFLAL